MKKSLILLFSLLSVMSFSVFAGCEKGDGGSDMKTPENDTEIVTLEEENPDGGEDGVKDGCPDDNCPDGGCGRRAPKRKFGHKHGRPVQKQDSQ